jgi:ribosome maturation factor RimP
MFLARFFHGRECGMSKKGMVDRARGILEEQLPAMGYELWDIEYGKFGGQYELTVYIDKPDGVGTDDCEAVSKALGARLDEESGIETSYYLIVSSPGLDRRLVTDGHYARYTGSEVDVSLYKAVDGRKKLSGTLAGRTETELILNLDGVETRVPRDLVSKVRLKVII